MSSNSLQVLIESHTKDLKQDQLNREKIERDTVGQTSNELWLEKQGNFLTSTYFGPICRRKRTTPTAPLVEQILYPNPPDVAAIKHSNEIKEKSRNKISKI